MKSWNITMITGLLGVLYFFLISLVFAPMNLALASQITFFLLSAVALGAVVINARESNGATWKTWVGLIGALLMVIPGLSALVGSLLLWANNSAPSTMVNTLFSVSAIGVLYLLPIGIAMCLIAGFARFYQDRRIAA